MPRPSETTSIPMEESEKRHRGQRHKMKQRKPGHPTKPDSEVPSDDEAPLNSDSKSVVSQDLVDGKGRRKIRKPRYIEESTVHSLGHKRRGQPDGNEDIIQVWPPPRLGTLKSFLS